MPETGFVLADADERILVQHILNSGAVLVPDLHYPTDQPIEISDIESFALHRARTRLFFVIHPSFFEVPLEMRQILKDGQQVWYVGQRSGGPAITLLLCVVFHERDRLRISEGSIHHYPTYWHPNQFVNRPAPEPLRQFYAATVKVLKSTAHKHKIGKRNYWIGRQTGDALNDGELDLGFGPGV
jgi:hypothetical protein